MRTRLMYNRKQTIFFLSGGMTEVTERTSHLDGMRIHCRGKFFDLNPEVRDFPFPCFIAKLDVYERGVRSRLDARERTRPGDNKYHIDRRLTALKSTAFLWHQFSSFSGR